jgi:hypothetical protein
MNKAPDRGQLNLMNEECSCLRKSANKHQRMHYSHPMLQFYSYAKKATLLSVVLTSLAWQRIWALLRAKATQTTVNPYYSSFYMQ